MSRGPDASTLLQRSLLRSAQGKGLSVGIMVADETQWASATFTGARHTIWLRAPDDESVESWLAALPDAELPVRGHLVADLVLIGRRSCAGEIVAGIEALTVEDR
ncbi:hypothetical protein [Stakelama saccharophila]|uniref:Uncharacterized protein n=1 Tax=Stakelama saccharophila TaxID=3075605 RepID=A0ABZ0B7N0_9SPHN|nr:hypothetical protein [Stakelama sp. W311]WNO53295.1 hypothetical protein RPR59_12705 [Stakelama sp. W311]